MRNIFGVLWCLALVGSTLGAVSDIINLYRSARQHMDGLLVYTKDLLCVSAGVHGLMNKTAVQRPWGDTATTSLKAYVNNEMPIYYRSMLYISDKYKFIYIRHSKASSTTLRLMLAAQFCRHNAQHLCKKEELRYHINEPIDPAVWREYFIFTFVRNPWARMASAYEFFHSSLVATKLPDGSIGAPCVAVPFRNFTENTFSMYRACELRRCCVLMPGFGGKPDHFNQQNLNPHIGDLNHHVFTTAGESMVDFVGRTEHLREDWEEMLRHLGSRVGTVFEPIGEIQSNTLRSNLSQACSASYYETMYDEETLRNVALQYAVDIQRFRYFTPNLTRTGPTSFDRR